MVSKKPSFPYVADRTIKKKLASLPIAHKGMSTKELRQLCVDFFRLQLSFPWVPSEDFVLHSPTDPSLDRIFSKDTVCGGLPYVSVGGGTIYRAMEFYDEATGVLDVSQFHDQPQLFGNACSSSSTIAWSRVISSAFLRWTHDMSHSYGFLRLGPYKSRDDIKSYIKKDRKNPLDPANYAPMNICVENGKQTMYESYALLLPGDGLVSNGHVRMCCQPAVVVRTADGQISGDESFVLYIDQCKPRKALSQCDGSPIIVQGGIDVKISFSRLFDKGYIPVTFSEFHGGEVADAYVETISENASLSLDELKSASVSSNYLISDVFVKILDQSGKVLFQDAIRPLHHHYKKVELKELSSFETLAKLERDGNHTIEISCQSDHGEILVAYRGFFSAISKEKERIIADPFTAEKLALIPIATEEMSTDELRKICVDYMKLQISFPFTLKEDYDYIIERKNKAVSLKKETAYAGLPYVTKGSGNLYRILECYDEESGVLNVEKLGDNPKFFGNACSGAACSAWARVINSVSGFGYTRHMTQKNGFLPVGDYKYSEDLEEFIQKEIDVDRPEGTAFYTPKDICKENKKKMMFSCYAKLLPGDGMVCPGHVRMVEKAPEIVLDQDGVVDPYQSYVSLLDQVATWKVKKQPDGSEIYVQGGINTTYSFIDLYNIGYIPFTFKEFLGTEKVKKATVSLSAKSDTLSMQDAEEITVFSNYLISDLFITVSDEAGNKVYQKVIRTDDFNIREMNLKDAFGEDCKTLKGNFSLRLEIQLFNGEKKTAFNGKLSI